MDDLLRAVCRNDATKVTRLLADSTTDPTANKNIAVRQASWFGRLDIVKILLTDERVDPSDRGNDAIKMASLCGHAEIVKLLLTDERVDPSSSDNQAIILAASNILVASNTSVFIDVIRILLEDPRTKWTPFLGLLFQLKEFDNLHKNGVISKFICWANTR